MAVCPECGFDDLSPIFLSKEDGEQWQANIVWPRRHQYWATLKNFKIEGTRLLKFHETTDARQKAKIPFGVTSIDPAAFRFCRNVTSIHIPDSVTRVEDSTFATCWDLQELVLPKNIEQLGNNFAGSADRTILPADNEYYIVENNCLIEKQTQTIISICNRSVESIVIPAGIKQIAPYTFRDCVNLKHIAIPDSVTSIGECAFLRCKNIHSVTLPQYIEEIHHSAFKQMGNRHIYFQPTRNGKYSVEEGCIVDNETQTLLFACDNEIRQICIPLSVRKIGSNAFAECKCIEEFVCPDYVVTIGDDAFEHCSKLKSVVLPTTLQTLGAGAFNGCSMLEKISIPEGITRISPETFKDCFALKSIKLPTTLKYIGFCAFLGCGNLREVRIPTGVKEIDFHAFYACHYLHCVIIPETVTKMGDRAFAECPNLDRLFCEAEAMPDGWRKTWLEHSFVLAYWNDVWRYDDNGNPRFIWDF